MADDRHARISEHAYRLWQQEGEPHGRDQAHWEEAERAFAGEGPVADEPDPQDGDPQAGDPQPTTQDTSGDTAPFAAPEQPASAEEAPSDAQAPAAPAAATSVDVKPAAAKKPAARRKRTT
ncbi:DUF2934 domain-containing protein [uncultured Sphingomonas sp.]|uniref:DUF2934 domain-containing protein n=1 Tax=uncultured Sphingomonas sp. TaxID=158754 RepID=UPI0030FC700B